MPPPGHLALATGLLASSYFAFANIGTAYFGVMPATARGKTPLPVAARLALWKSFYDVAKIHMGGSGVISAVALSAAAYLASARPLRNVLVAGAGAASLSAAWTVLFMLPLNHKLIATLESTAVKPMELEDEQRVLDQLDRWRAMHRVRIVLGAIAWLASAIPLFATDRVLWYVPSVYEFECRQF
ncbi:hypothetical protein DFH09DRAFT_1327394 [Mycena vulgaris]|nr:hypothetical protein DFH09DRAFT_1327394 [Mycena vulgaris]